MSDQEPRITHQGNIIYCVTKYIALPDGTYKAITKHDITDQLSRVFNSMIDSAMVEVKKNRLVGNYFIVCLCGNSIKSIVSSDAYTQLREQGNMVICLEAHHDRKTLTNLDMLHVQLCDVLFVDDTNGTSESIERVIQYAKELGKQIQYLYSIEKNAIVG